MKLQKQQAGMKNKQGENYISGYRCVITKKEIEASGIDPDAEIKKEIQHGKIIIKQKAKN